MQIVNVDIQDRQPPTWRYNKFARRYQMTGTQRDFEKKPRIYVWPEGETIITNLIYGRRNRPVRLYREALRPVLAELGVEKIEWSQTAGCSCPCSPGFIATMRADSPLAGRRLDIHIAVTPTPEEIEAWKAVEEEV